MRRLILGALCVPLLLATMAGCPNQSSPKRIPDGATPISKNMRGIWNAPGGKSCRWWVADPDGSISNGGNVGQTLRSDSCGGWTK